MHGEGDRELRKTLEAFEEACRELVEALAANPDALDGQFERAQARLREAQQALEAARLRNRQTRS